jgi:hypothetical protein
MLKRAFGEQKGQAEPEPARPATTATQTEATAREGDKVMEK